MSFRNRRSLAMGFNKTGDEVKVEETFEIQKKKKLSDFNGEAAKLNEKLEGDSQDKAED